MDISICGNDLVTPYDCLRYGSPAKVVGAQLALFCGGTGLAEALFRTGLLKKPTDPKSAEYRSPLYLGWFFPAIVFAPYIAYLAIVPLRDMWYAPPDVFYGTFDHKFGNAVAEGMVCFFLYILIDTVLSSALGFATAINYIHHVLFGVLCAIGIYRNAMPGLVAVMLAQEVSTLPLNLYMLNRPFGYQNFSTDAWFVLFTFLFVCGRLILNFATVGDLALRLYSDSNVAWFQVFSYWEKWLIFITLLLGSLLQICWGVVVISRTVRIVRRRMFGSTRKDHAD